jgi:hypothetical protein
MKQAVSDEAEDDRVFIFAVDGVGSGPRWVRYGRKGR